MPVNLAPEISSVHTILSPNGAFGYLGSFSKDTEIESDANRLLIAAAPEMLQAIHDALNNLPADGECAEFLHTVVAKATGAVA